MDFPLFNSSLHKAFLSAYAPLDQLFRGHKQRQWEIPPGSPLLSCYSQKDGALAGLWEGIPYGTSLKGGEGTGLWGNFLAGPR